MSPARSPVRRASEVCWLVALGVGPLLLNPWSQEAFDQPKALLTIGLAVVLGLLLCLEGWRRVPLAIPGALVLASYGLATLFGKAPLVSWKGNYVRGEIGGTLLVLAYAVIAYAIARHLKEARQFERLCLAIALTASLAALYAVAQASGHDPIGWVTPNPVGSPDATGIPTRPGSTIGDANGLGFYLMMALPFVVATRRRWTWPVAVLVLGGLLLTASRGAIAGVGAEGVALLFMHRRPEHGLLALGALAVFVVFVGTAFRPDSGTQRLTVWRDVAGFIAQRPVLGYGPETLGSVYTREDVAVDATRWNKSHNRVLDSLAERGALGLAADLLLLGAAARLAVRRRTRAAVVALCAVAGAWVAAMFDVTPGSAWLLEWASYGVIASGVQE